MSSVVSSSSVRNQKAIIVCAPGGSGKTMALFKSRIPGYTICEIRTVDMEYLPNGRINSDFSEDFDNAIQSLLYSNNIVLLTPTRKVEEYLRQNNIEYHLVDTEYNCRNNSSIYRTTHILKPDTYLADYLESIVNENA